MKWLLVFLPLSTLWSASFDTTILKEYQPINYDFLYNGQNFKAIRTWKKEGISYYLVLNQQTFTTMIHTNLPKAQTHALTPFSKLTKKLLSHPHKLHNFGITAPTNDKIFLTIDMCPSKKPGYEKELFAFIKTSRSVANIAITGAWMKSHGQDFDALIERGIKIRWINHSLTHFYDRDDKNWTTNFMLRHPENFDQEVLEVEKLLIINHQTPSIFFRFPGLISNQHLTTRLIRHFNLLPLGTNNWVNVSNKAVQKGEIILLHGNLNEHSGIVKFFEQDFTDKQFSAIEEIF